MLSEKLGLVKSIDNPLADLSEIPKMLLGPIKSLSKQITDH
jgi:hypothetical protein